MLQVCLKEVKGPVQKVSGWFQECVKDVYRLFPKYLKRVSWILKKIQGISKKFHAAWHSSQLYKQKKSWFILMPFAKTVSSAL